jgi:hypothetical protein
MEANSLYCIENAKNWYKNEADDHGYLIIIEILSDFRLPAIITLFSFLIS